MGLFDFLKGKSKAGEPAREQRSMQAALDDLSARLGGKSRFWHYFIAHVGLRDLALRGEGLPAAAREPGGAPGFFAFILRKMAPHLGITDAEAERFSQGFTVHARDIGGRDCAIVELPPPEGPTECRYVALVPTADGKPARYFTLEYAAGGEWVLGGWEDERHLNFGAGPEPALDAFAAAVAARL